MSIFNKTKKDWKTFLINSNKFDLVQERGRIDEEIEALKQKKRDIRDEIVAREQSDIVETDKDQTVSA